VFKPLNTVAGLVTVAPAVVGPPKVTPLMLKGVTAPVVEAPPMVAVEPPVSPTVPPFRILPIPASPEVPAI